MKVVERVGMTRTILGLPDKLETVIIKDKYEQDDGGEVCLSVVTEQQEDTGAKALSGTLVEPLCVHCSLDEIQPSYSFIRILSLHEFYLQILSCASCQSPAWLCMPIGTVSFLWMNLHLGKSAAQLQETRMKKLQMYYIAFSHDVLSLLLLIMPQLSSMSALSISILIVLHRFR